MTEALDMIKMINEFLDSNPKIVKDFKKYPRAANAVIGEVVKKTQGKYRFKDVVDCVNAELAKRVSNNIEVKL